MMCNRHFDLQDAINLTAQMERNKASVLLW